jgi:geranylgeranyl pyrophosphate synthase
MNIESFIQSILKNISHPEINEVMSYAVLPTGKLFRPQLCFHIARDLKLNDHEDLSWWAAAIELHHAYTLVHDDLPCMDNDDVRRGKPSTHKAYGEWKALLAGDALLIESFRCLGFINSPLQKNLHRLFAKATTGLIEGQWMDLSLDGQKSIHHLIRMHELKTARLMQLSLLGPWSLAHPQTNLYHLKRIASMGNSIGIIFQLLDDLDDLSGSSEHEDQINPFLRFENGAFEALFHHFTLLKRSLQQYQLHELKNYLKTFLDKTNTQLKNKSEISQKKLKSEKNFQKLIATDTWI